MHISTYKQITVAARSKAWTVFARLNIGIMGSNLTQGMDICLHLFCVCVVLCVGSGLATGCSHVQGVLPTVYMIKELKMRPMSNKRTADPLIYIYIRILSIYGSTVRCWTLTVFFRFLIQYTAGRTSSTGSQPVTRPLHTHRTQTQNKRTQTSMPRVGFKPTIPAFERAKIVHALDRAATGIGV
jgi:hypothetical protein